MPVEVVCHNDFSPHNLAFRNGVIIGAIDFDMCSPGPRNWDLAYIATRMVPLTSQPQRGAPVGADVSRRIQLLLDAYGPDVGSVPLTVEAVVQVAVRRLYELADFSRKKADELSKPELRDEADGYERDAAFQSQT